MVCRYHELNFFLKVILRRLNDQNLLLLGSPAAPSFEVARSLGLVGLAGRRHRQSHPGSFVFVFLRTPLSEQYAYAWDQ